MLTLRDRQIIDFERWSIRLPEPKDMTVTEILGISSKDYYTRLGQLIRSAEAAQYDPLTIRRLRKMVGVG